MKVVMVKCGVLFEVRTGLNHTLNELWLHRVKLAAGVNFLCFAFSSCKDRIELNTVSILAVLSLIKI
jgi:hypothetical protein